MIDRSPETSRQTYVRIGGHVLQTHGSQKENTMKAIVGDTYGSPDVLKLRDIDKPDRQGVPARRGSRGHPVADVLPRSPL
jgi:hypothetical protein